MVNQPIPIKPDESSYRAPNGNLIAPIPGSEKTRITPANARSMAERRWEKFRRAAVSRIVGEAQSVDLSVSTAADAFALLASKQYVALLDYDKPRIDELEKMGNILAGGPQVSKQEDSAPLRQIAEGMTAAMLDVWRDVVQSTIPAQLHDTIEGEVRE